MKFITLTFIVAALLVAGCSTEQKKDDPVTKVETASIALPTIMCDQCEAIIEKATFAVEGVKSLDIDVEKKTAEVKFASFQTNVATIERAIAEAGYDANSVKRDSIAYTNLPGCCKNDG